MKPTNPTNLDLSFTLPVVKGFDYAGLKAWAEGIKSKYADVVVMEDQIIETKAEMAELNRIKKQLDTARIAAVRKVSEPIRDFEAQVKEVCAIFDATYAYLGDPVKGYEERAREEKRQEVLFAIQTLTAEAGYPGLEIPVQDSWLNKSQKPKQTAADIQAFILRHVQAEHAAAAAEQAKQDRAVAIESQNAALAQGYGFTIPVSQFLPLFTMDVALVDVNERMTSAYRLKAEANARANVAPVAAPAAQVQPTPAPAPLDQPQGTPSRKGLTLSLVYDLAREGEINMVIRHLEALCFSLTRATSCGGGFPVPTQAQAPQRECRY